MFIRDTQGNGLAIVDTEILLSFILEKPRTWILSHPEYELSTAEAMLWNDVSLRRKKGEPVAYITGEKEFYGRVFIVNASTLIPRPATEILVETALKVLRGESAPKIIDADTDIVIASAVWGETSDIHTIVDIGTGSGCIGVTLACELSAMNIVATDISDHALCIAKENAARHHVSDRISFLKGDCLEPLKNVTEPFLIVSNPPYIPSSITLMKDVQHFEPHTALFSGKEGTDVLQTLITQAKAHPFCRGMIVECRQEQAVLLAS